MGFSSFKSERKKSLTLPKKLSVNLNFEDLQT